MKNPNSTKGRLLRAACKIFSEKGYRDATVAEICEQAEANIASVNYHFGDKAKLYYECFNYLFELSDQIYPLPEESSDPEKWLRGFVNSRMLNILDEGEAGLLPLLLHHEMGQPTDVHGRLYMELLEPRFSRVAHHTREFLGHHVSDAQLQIAVINLSSLHIFINVGRQRVRQTAETDLCSRGMAMDREAMSKQVEHFSIGGLIATRDFLNSENATHEE